MAYFLSCNNLTSPSCSVGNYVIDWHLNSTSGDIVFVSANSGNTEPGVDAFHPLVDEVVPAGTLYAVIRYIYVGADKITSSFEEGALHSPDLITCLGSVVIDPIDCAASNFTPTSTLPYDFRIIRNVGVGSKDRTFNFEISSSTQYFAWGFNADNISDQIKIYYCTLLDPDGILLDNLVCGTDATTNIIPASYPTNPIIIDASSSSEVIKYVSDLTSFSYTIGDYIKVEILGNYYNPSLDGTKWTIYMRCLESLGALPDMTPVFTKIGNTTISYSTVTCAYTFTYPVLDGHLGYAAYQNSDFKKYFFIRTLGAGLGNTLDDNITSHPWTETTTGTGAANFGCAAYAGTVTTAKVGSTITWTFTSPTDYELFRARYVSITGGIGYIASIGANATLDPEYYGHFQVMVMTNPNGCDQANTFIQLYIHWTSTWTLDPINQTTLSVSIVVPSNTLNAYGDCNDWNETVTTAVANMNTTLGLANFSYSQIKRFNPMSFHYGFQPYSKSFPSATDSSRFDIYIPNIMLNNIYTPTNALGYVSNFLANYWYVLPGKDISTFSSFATHEQRLNSWCFSRSRYFTTLDQADLNTNDVIDCAPSTTTTTTTV